MYKPYYTLGQLNMAVVLLGCRCCHPQLHPKLLPCTPAFGGAAPQLFLPFPNAAEPFVSREKASPELRDGGTGSEHGASSAFLTPLPITQLHGWGGREKSQEL